MNTEPIGVPSVNDPSDNLLQINGVGPGYADSLNRIEIRKFSDFLKYSSNAELHRALKEAGEDVPLWKITRYDWLGQARRLSESGVAEEDQPEGTLETVVETGLAEISDPPQYRQALAAGWAQFVGFNLYFEYDLEQEGRREWRTVVYKTLEPDSFNSKETFSGVEPSAWSEWIMNKAALPAEAWAPDEAVEAATQPLPAGNSLVIGDIEVNALPPSSEFPEKRIDTTMQFRLAGDNSATLADARASFRVEIYTLEMESRALNLVASGQGQLQPQVLEYKKHLLFPLPELGRYELYGLVLLLPPAEMVACRQGPIISIKP